MLYNISKINRLQIELTTRCNASCPVCTRNHFGGPVVSSLKDEELSIDDIRNMFSNDIAANLRSINYCGNLGDSALAKDLMPILEFFKSKSPTVTQVIRTNGGMKNENFWSQLGTFFKKPLKITGDIFSHSGIVFSVDGLEDTNHIYRRGVRWNKLIANMEAYSKAGGYGVWEWLIFDHNQHQINQAKDLANSLGFKFVLKNPVGYEDEFGNQRGGPVYSKTGNYEYTIYPAGFQGEKVDLKWFGDYKNFNEDTASNGLNHLKVNKTFSSIECKSIKQKESQEIFVTPSGHLLPCCYLGGPFSGVRSDTTYSRTQFYQLIQKEGLENFDLRKFSIKDVLTGPHFSKFFKEGWAKKTPEEGRLMYCQETCGKNSSVDRIYKPNSKVIQIKSI